MFSRSNGPEVAQTPHWGVWLLRNSLGEHCRSPPPPRQLDRTKGIARGPLPFVRFMNCLFRRSFVMSARSVEVPEIAPFRGRACFAREGKRKRGEIGCFGASQRLTVPPFGGTAEPIWCRRCGRRRRRGRGRCRRGRSGARRWRRCRSARRGRRREPSRCPPAQPPARRA